MLENKKEKHKICTRTSCIQIPFFSLIVSFLFFFLATSSQSDVYRERVIHFEGGGSGEEISHFLTILLEKSTPKKKKSNYLSLTQFPALAKKFGTVPGLDHGQAQSSRAAAAVSVGAVSPSPKTKQDLHIVGAVRSSIRRQRCIRGITSQLLLS